MGGHLSPARIRRSIYSRHSCGCSKSGGLGRLPKVPPGHIEGAKSRPAAVEDSGQGSLFKRRSPAATLLEKAKSQDLKQSLRAAISRDRASSATSAPAGSFDDERGSTLLPTLARGGNETTPPPPSQSPSRYWSPRGKAGRALKAQPAFLRHVLDGRLPSQPQHPIPSKAPGQPRRNVQRGRAVLAFRTSGPLRANGGCRACQRFCRVAGKTGRLSRSTRPLRAVGARIVVAVQIRRYPVRANGAVAGGGPDLTGPEAVRSTARWLARMSSGPEQVSADWSMTFPLRHMDRALVLALSAQAGDAEKRPITVARGLQAV